MEEELNLLIKYTNKKTNESICLKISDFYKKEKPSAATLRDMLNGGVWQDVDTFAYKIINA